jgi:hypothetical protein
MVNVWVTRDDLILALGSPGPWTADDRRLQDITVTGVDAYIKEVRPDLSPPASVTSPTGSIHSAFASSFNTAFVPPGVGDQVTAASWAALQLALHWWSIRGTASPNTYEEFGVTTQFAVPRFVEEALGLGRSHAPVVA